MKRPFESTKIVVEPSNKVKLPDNLDIDLG